MPNDTISSLIDLLRSTCAREIRLQLDQAAANDLPVLLYGETGTGKDVWASYLHSKKKEGPFISIHCADIPDTLIESQWFGYKKGAFTGATTDHSGLWLNAKNGVLYLNRIDLLKTDIQSKLLRVIERKRFFPLNSNEEISIDAQFVFSTDENILEQVEAGQFRTDLYYRISAFSIRIPPLRERKDDILPLLTHFASHSGVSVSLTSKTIDTLLCHPWIGNIRELENLVHRCILSEGQLSDHVILSMLRQTSFITMIKSQELSLSELETRYIKHLLQRHKNKAQVARILGITRKTLYNKLKEYGKD